MPPNIDYKIPVEIERLKYFRSSYEFPLELGGSLPELGIAYHTYGRLNGSGDNVIWVCHALTANSAVADWWPGMVGPGCAFDTDKYFVVCANILGSCYGSTGPRSLDPSTGQAYGLNFPKTTIRDQVNAHQVLAKYLGVKKIKLCAGGSGGGHQVLEFALCFPELINKILVSVSSARETAWSIAIHEGQRLALSTDPDFPKNRDDAGKTGLIAARAMALVNYRTIKSYNDAQTASDERTESFPASSYVKYQGEKLAKRFYSHCYYHLLNTLDTHHVGRGRGKIEDVLAGLKQEALIIGLDSDRLIPITEQKFLAKHIPNAHFEMIHSDYGHDGFLIETAKLTRIIQKWF